MPRLRRLITILFFALTITSVAFPSALVPAHVAEAATKAALNKTAVTVYVGNSYLLKLSGTTQKVKWTTSNKSIAAVSTAGKVTAVKKGSSTITATVGTKKYTCKVTVKDYSISDKTLTLYRSDKELLKINGATGTVTWKSSDAKVAAVNKTGIVTAVGYGTAKITGTYNKKSYSCTVTVKNMISTDSTELTISEDTAINVTMEGFQKGDTYDYSIEKGGILDVVVTKVKDNVYQFKLIPIKEGVENVTIDTSHNGDRLTVKVTVKDLKPTFTSDGSQTQKLSSEEIYKLCEKSSIQINTKTAEGNIIGSGFFIKERWVVTNYHVIKGATSIEIQSLNGGKFIVDSVLGYSEELDIAILSVMVSSTPFKINSHGVTVGETVYTIGSSQGLTGTFTNGIVSNSSRSFDNVNYIQINAAITNGNSGGPLLNEYGEVMGINTMQYVEGQNLNFAINIDQLNKVDLDHPMKPSEFYELSKTSNPSSSDSGDSDFIYENDVLNDEMSTAPAIPSGSLVAGYADNNNMDYYKLIITTTTYATVVAMTEDKYDIKYLYMAIIDSDGNVVTYAEEDTIEGTPYLGIYQYLSPGTYYLGLFSDPNVYVYSPVTYAYSISY